MPVVRERAQRRKPNAWLLGCLLSLLLFAVLPIGSLMGVAEFGVQHVALFGGEFSGVRPGPTDFFGQPRRAPLIEHWQVRFGVLIDVWTVSVGPYEWEFRRPQRRQ